MNIKVKKVDEDTVSSTPLLKHTMRKLYLRIHPDLFQRYPDIATTNEESFQKLMGFFNTIKEGEIIEIYIFVYIGSEHSE